MSKLSPQRKAAIAIVAMGPERAAAVLRSLPADKVAEIAAEIDTLGTVTTEELGAVLVEIQGNDNTMLRELPAPTKEFTRELVSTALGPDRSAPVLAELDRPKPFAWLLGADPEVIGPIVEQQPPSVIALALAHMDPELGAALLGRLPDALRNDVAHRIAALGQILPETVVEVEQELRDALRPVMETVVARISGPDVLAALLQRAERQHERSVMQALGRKAPDLAEATRAALFTFDDAMSLDGRSMQTLLKAVEAKDLATALVKSDDDTKAKVLGNLSERARANLVEEMDLVTRATAAEVTAARKAVVLAARRLEEEGTLDLSRRNDAA